MSLKPILHIAEEDWQRLRDDYMSEESTFGYDVDFVGSISLGGVSAEIVIHGDEEKSSPPAPYICIRGFEGYAATEDGVPYTLCSDNGTFDIPYDCESYPEFLEKIEENFMEFCSNLKDNFTADRTSPKKARDNLVWVDDKVAAGYTDDIVAILDGANGVWS